jgi:hypothetical protein
MDIQTALNNQIATPRLPLRSELPRLVRDTKLDRVGTTERLAFGDDGLTFGDVLDVVNPLQHIPVVSTVYREVTDDEISNLPRLLGSGLFGGLFSLAGAAVNVVVREFTGKDIGEHVVDLVTPDEEPVAFDDGPVEEPAFASMLDAFEYEFGGEQDALARSLAPSGDEAPPPVEARPTRLAQSTVALGEAIQAYRTSSAADTLLDAKLRSVSR